MPDDPDAPTGAVDAVTRGVDAVLGREVAMVALPPVRGDDLVVRTEQVRRLAALHHAHLLEVFDVDGLAEDTESTLVLQSVDGRGLDPARDRARWSSLAVAEIGAQTASALAHAHGRGVVHGAIGPASVVVGGTDVAPFAWLTGFTAALHPDPAAVPGDPTAAPTPDRDVAALGRVLALALDPDAFAATTLEHALADMTRGGAGAVTAAESLGRIAESLRRADEDETGLVPVVTADAGAPDPGALPTGHVVGPAVHVRGVGLVGLVGAAAPAVAGSVPGRWWWRAGRGPRMAVLGGATLVLAAASGLVLWASEAPSVVTPRPAGLSSVPAPPPLPPVAVAPSSTASPDDAEVDRRTTRRTSRPPITSDVTTAPPPPVVVPPPVVAPVAPPVVPPPAAPPPTPPDPDPTTTTSPPVRGPGQNATLAAS